MQFRPRLTNKKEEVDGWLKLIHYVRSLGGINAALQVLLPKLEHHVHNVTDETPDYVVKFTKGGITHTVTVTGVDGEPLVIQNEFPAGITYFTITDPDSVTTCYYIKIERSEAVCPGVIIDDKTLSTC